MLSEEDFLRLVIDLRQSVISTIEINRNYRSYLFNRSVPKQSVFTFVVGLLGKVSITRSTYCCRICRGWHKVRCSSDIVFLEGSRISETTVLPWDKSNLSRWAKNTNYLHPDRSTQAGINQIRPVVWFVKLQHSPLFARLILHCLSSHSEELWKLGDLLLATWANLKSFLYR